VYSQIIGFPPCELCWIQRIFIFPQPLLAFIAIRANERGIMKYLLSLSIIGGCVALYHSYVQWGGNVSLAPCVAEGGECAKVFVLSHGYITIPFMSFTVFAYLIALAVVYYKASVKKI
jgi:disulfide bond formation protein DsbB